MMRNLIEGIEGILAEATVEVAKSKENVHAEAATFFNKGILPDGTKWGMPVEAKWGFDNGLKRTKEQWKETSDGAVFSIRYRVAPGSGGGGGIGVDPRASNQLFNMVGTDPKALSGAGKAFEAFVKRQQKRLNEALRRWLLNPENAPLMGLVGSRSGYRVVDVMLKSVRTEGAMIDPTRRKWPAGRTEIWVPATVDAVLTLKRK